MMLTRRNMLAAAGASAASVLLSRAAGAQSFAVEYLYAVAAFETLFLTGTGAAASLRS